MGHPHSFPPPPPPPPAPPSPVVEPTSLLTAPNHTTLAVFESQKYGWVPNCT